jgi:hypothetical protein
MAKGFAVGDLVQIEASELALSGFEGKASGLLVINEPEEPWMGLTQWEVKDSEGESYTVTENSLVHV